MTSCIFNNIFNIYIYFCHIKPLTVIILHSSLRKIGKLKKGLLFLTCQEGGKKMIHFRRDVPGKMDSHDLVG